jgi:hypothetical protein
VRLLGEFGGSVDLVELPLCRESPMVTIANFSVVGSSDGIFRDFRYLICTLKNFFIVFLVVNITVSSYEYDYVSANCKLLAKQSNTDTSVGASDPRGSARGLTSHSNTTEDQCYRILVS